MKKLFSAVLGCLLLVACSTTQQTTTYKTLATVATGVDMTYAYYNDLLVTQKIPTNSIGTVVPAYMYYRNVMGLAVALAQGNTNAIATGQVLSAASTFTVVCSNAICWYVPTAVGAAK